MEVVSEYFVPKRESRGLKYLLSLLRFIAPVNIEDGTIRLWQTIPGKSYGLWQGNPGVGSNGHY